MKKQIIAKIGKNSNIYYYLCFWDSETSCLVMLTRSGQYINCVSAIGCKEVQFKSYRQLISALSKKYKHYPVSKGKKRLKEFNISGMRTFKVIKLIPKSP